MLSEAVNLYYAVIKSTVAYLTLLLVCWLDAPDPTLSTPKQLKKRHVQTFAINQPINMKRYMSWRAKAFKSSSLAYHSLTVDWSRIHEVYLTNAWGVTLEFHKYVTSFPLQPQLSPHPSGFSPTPAGPTRINFSTRSGYCDNHEVFRRWPISSIIKLFSSVWLMCAGYVQLAFLSLGILQPRRLQLRRFSVEF